MKKNKNITKLGFVVILILFFTKDSNAQDLDLVKIGYVNYPGTGIKEGEGDVEHSFQEFGASFNIPYKLKNKKTAIVNGFSYGWIENTTVNLPINELEHNKEQLHALTYQLMIAQKLSEKWRLIINLRPTIASDMETKISSDDFVLRGGAFAINKINEYLSLGGGVASTMRFGQPQVIPLILFNYKKGKHSIKALLPVKSAYNYSLGSKEKLKIGLMHHINGAQFNITAPEVEKYGFPEIDKIRYSRANIGATINYMLTKFIHFKVYGGASVRRKYELLDEANTTHLFDLKEAPFIQFGISIVPPRMNTTQ